MPYQPLNPLTNQTATAMTLAPFQPRLLDKTTPTSPKELRTKSRNIGGLFELLEPVESLTAIAGPTPMLCSKRRILTFQRRCAASPKCRKHYMLLDNEQDR